MLLRELPGPPGAPVVVLLHGWTATADLNFYSCYEALGAALLGARAGDTVAYEAPNGELRVRVVGVEAV